MDGKSLVADLPSVSVATKLQKELAAFFPKVAAEIDKATSKAGGERPEDATPLAIAFGKKHGIRWDESPFWGDEEALAGNEPEVGALGASLAVFHVHSPGGFGAELTALLKKAGGKVRTADRPPLVYGELPAKSALVKKLVPFFDKRLGGEALSAWGKPPWDKRALGIGAASDVRFAVDAASCVFVMPLVPSSFEPLRAALAKAGGSLRLASAADEKVVTKREAGPATKSAPAKSTAAIPSKAPVVTREKRFAFTRLFSTGATLFAVRDADVASGPTPEKLKPLAKLGDDLVMTSIFADDTEVFVAGDALLRGKLGGKSLAKVKLPPGVDPAAWSHEFDGVARDPSGVVWSGGTDVVTLRGDKVNHEKSFGKDAKLTAIVPTPYGTLLLTYGGLAYLANDGKAQRLGLRGKGHLNAACVTPRGTIVVVGSGAKWSAEVHRSEDGGKTWKPARLTKLAPLKAVAALADGRLVAGGGELLIASTDDGKTWKPVKTPKDIYFDVLCAHGSEVLGEELRIR